MEISEGTSVKGLGWNMPGVLIEHEQHDSGWSRMAKQKGSRSWTHLFDTVSLFK